MKISRSAIIAVALASNLVAAEYNRPSHCVGTKLAPSIGKVLLKEDYAICDGDWRFGINENGVFGLWDEHELVEKFVTGAEALKVYEKDDGEKAGIVVYDDDHDIIWELSCEDLDGKSHTKLFITDDEDTHVVKFGQGSGYQGKLWRIFSSGNDSDNENYCKLSDGDKKYVSSNDYKLVVLEEDRDFCIGLDSNHDLIAVNCDPDDNAQLWDFNSGGRWRPKNYEHKCVCTEELDGGEDLFVEHCDDAFDWVYQSSTGKIRPEDKMSLCVTYEDKLSHGVDIELGHCSDDDAFSWDIIDPDTYKPSSYETEKYSYKYKLAVLQEDEDFCIGIDSTKDLVLVECNPTDKSQLWALFDDQLRSKKYSGYCATSKSKESDEDLYLVECDHARDWVYDKNDDHEITPYGDNELCVTYDGSKPMEHDDIELDHCNGDDSQAWEFVEPDDYHPSTWSTSSNDDYEDALVVLQEDDRYCISWVWDDSDDRKELEIVHCDPDDEKQLWNFEDGGTWRPKKYSDLCVCVSKAVSGKDLFMEDCNNNSFAWLYDLKDNHEIKPEDNKHVCVTYENGLKEGADVELYTCDGEHSQSWDFVYPSKYHRKMLRN